MFVKLIRERQIECTTLLSFSPTLVATHHYLFVFEPIEQCHRLANEKQTPRAAHKIMKKKGAENINDVYFLKGFLNKSRNLLLLPFLLLPCIPTSYQFSDQKVHKCPACPFCLFCPALSGTRPLAN